MEKRDWQELVEEWRSSGLSRSEFCRRKGISASSFHPHVVKSRLSQSSKPKPDSKQTFIRLGEFIEIELPGGSLTNRQCKHDDELRKHSKRNLPTGSPDFVAHLESLSGVNLQYQSVGRPRKR